MASVDGASLPSADGRGRSYDADVTDKSALRATARARRRALTTAQRRRRSLAAAANLLGLEEVRAASAVGLYAPLADEVDPQPAATALRELGVAVVLPRVTGDHLELVEVDDLRDLRPGFRGVLEPQGAAGRPEVEVLVVPGLAFDRRGGRLGQGGGHYDRLLADLPAATLRVGLSFACQVVDEVPREPHDEPIDVLVTEEEVVRHATRTPDR